MTKSKLFEKNVLQIVQGGRGRHEAKDSRIKGQGAHQTARSADNRCASAKFEQVSGI